MVITKLDTHREIRFGFKAIKMVKAMTGKGLIDIMKGMDRDNPFMDEDTFLKVAFCGLIGGDKELTIEKVEDLIDRVNYSEFFGDVVKAITEAYSGEKPQEVTGEPEQELDKKK